MSGLSPPDIWVQQHDTDRNHSLRADTRVNPPRSVWVHPYEDEQFLAAYPEAKAKKETLSNSNLDAPPSYDVVTEECSTSWRGERPGSLSHASSPTERNLKRGVFGRLKDKAIGTKKEREERKRIKAAHAARVKERRHIRAEQRARAEEETRLWELEEREAYYRAYGYGEPQRGSFEGNSVAPCVVGGLVGGILVGSIFGI